METTFDVVSFPFTDSLYVWPFFLKKKIAIWHMERKHIIPWEHSYLSNRFFTSHYVSASWVRQDLTSVDQILFALSDFRTCLKACVVSRDTLTRSTLSECCWRLAVHLFTREHAVGVTPAVWRLLALIHSLFWLIPTSKDTGLKA